MDYLKSVVPSQLIAERGANLVVINPGSGNVRVGLAHQQKPLNVPHCIARYMREWDQGSEITVQDQILNYQLSPAQHLEREKAYDIIASVLKIPFLDEETVNNSYPRKMGRVDGLNMSSRNDSAFTWANVTEKISGTSDNSNAGNTSESLVEQLANKDDKGVSLDQPESVDDKEPNHEQYKFRDVIFGEEALRISPSEPYYLRHPIRRGHFNISQHYTMHQVLEDLSAIWDWILKENLHIPCEDRIMFSVVLVVPETFDNQIKEMLSIVLKDLRFGSAVVHQESLAAAFGNGLSTACVVNLGAQVTSIMCIEDGVTLPMTGMTLPYGGEDISRCLLWVQQHHQTWPTGCTDPLVKPIDMLVINNIKESYCQIREGEFDALALVHSYEDGMQVTAHKTRLSSLNVPPMGLFFPQVLAPDAYPPPPRTWFHDYEDMLEDTWHMEFPRRPDVSDGFYANVNGGLNMWESYPVFPSRLKREDNLGLAEAITSSILSTGRIDLKRKLFCSIQLIGGVVLTSGLVPAVEERVLHAIPSNEAIETVEVLQPRTDPSFVAWKGGAILGILDFGRDAWIHREDWIRSGIHVGSGRKYKDSFFLQAQAMCYINN
ncbi:actin-related protein 9 isoform X2 [Aristolochia californica]|uniref:actin-related protein 9 isoform X2 n=1 Tax=Aristolochia californica TaxID=171875 RepID=UPI0035E18FF2